MIDKHKQAIFIRWTLSQMDFPWKVGRWRPLKAALPLAASFLKMLSNVLYKVPFGFSCGMLWERGWDHFWWIVWWFRGGTDQSPMSLYVVCAVLSSCWTYMLFVKPTFDVPLTRFNLLIAVFGATINNWARCFLGIYQITVASSCLSACLWVRHVGVPPVLVPCDSCSLCGAQKTGGVWVPLPQEPWLKVSKVPEPFPVLEECTVSTPVLWILWWIKCAEHILCLK